MSKKLVLIIVGIVLSLILMFWGMGISKYNQAIYLEEQLGESKSSINIQEKRREDLILNLVDCVESYNKHEQDTMTKIVEARSKAINGEIVEAQALISAVAEQYPELKSNENYKTLMTELAVTENLIAGHRDNYNIQVKAYKKFVRNVINKMILSWNGYEAIEVDYLEYEASVDSPKNLFD